MPGIVAITSIYCLVNERPPDGEYVSILPGKTADPTWFLSCAALPAAAYRTLRSGLLGKFPHFIIAYDGTLIESRPNMLRRLGNKSCPNFISIAAEGDSRLDFWTYDQCRSAAIFLMLLTVWMNEETDWIRERMVPVGARRYVGRRKPREQRELGSWRCHFPPVLEVDAVHRILDIYYHGIRHYRGAVPKTYRWRLRRVRNPRLKPVSAFPAPMSGTQQNNKKLER